MQNVATILEKRPKMAGQVSTSTLSAVHGSQQSNPAANVTINKELQKRAASGDYEQVSSRKKPKYR